jgi:nucleotide-binding universal stress UspA family protein
MNNKSPFNSLLVPTDFSEASQDAFQWALNAVDGNDSVIIVLHVLDEALIELIAAHEFGERDEVTKRLRKHATERLSEFKSAGSVGVEIDVIVSEGLPFLEIISKAEDFAVDAIVMGKVGMRDRFEKLLFGSTAEKVLRASRCPVIALPEPDRG